MDARAKGAPLDQHFELLERMLDESHKSRSMAPKPEEAADLEEKRAELIEKAARRVLSAQEGAALSDKELNALRAALMWDIALRDNTNSKGKSV